MRALRVVGLDESGTFVVCEDTHGERFKVAADEHLRAASRGDLTRLGQIEIELESQMRPREIQARIRAGESVEHVAEVASIPVQRVERFAYPVLLERSRTAELAQSAHPVRADGPDVQTLYEVAAQAFSQWGADFSTVTWDSWRADDGRWIVELGWQAGRSENAAHWAFSPGAHGGTVTPLDEHAERIMDPQSGRGLRTVGKPAPAEPEFLGKDPVEQEEIAEVIPTGDPILQPPVELVGDTLFDEPERVATAEDDEQAGKATAKRGKKNHPTVPSWEDVLLGVRSHR